MACFWMGTRTQEVHTDPLPNRALLLPPLRLCSAQLCDGANLGAARSARASVPGGWTLHHTALPGASWQGSQPCGVRAAAHQPAPWHRAWDASQPGEEAAWLAASSQGLSCQAGGRPGAAKPPWPLSGTPARPLLPGGQECRLQARLRAGALQGQGASVLLSFSPWQAQPVDWGEFSSRIIIKTATTTVDIDQVFTP